MTVSSLLPRARRPVIVKIARIAARHLLPLIVAFWAVLGLIPIAAVWPGISSLPAMVLSVTPTLAAGSFLTLLCALALDRVRLDPPAVRIMTGLIAAAVATLIFSVFCLIFGGQIFSAAQGGDMSAELGRTMLAHVWIFVVWCALLLLLEYALPEARLTSLAPRSPAASGVMGLIGLRGEAAGPLNQGLSFSLVWRYQLVFWTLNLVASLTLEANLAQFWRNLLVESSAVGMTLGAHFAVLYPTRHLELPARLALAMGSALLLNGLYLTMVWVAWFEILPYDLAMGRVDTSAGWAGLVTIAPNWFMLNVTTFVAWFALYLALEAVSRIRRQERQIYDTTLLAQDAQLKMLRFQLNPHFLFNTLNAISALVIDNRNVEAEGMLMRLSSFLRFALQATPDDKVSLESELGAQRLYLDIEKARFDSRLEVQIEAPDELREALLPSLILQPILENAIKFAVSNSTEPVTISITVSRQADALVIDIVDSGAAGTTDCEHGTGVGLANIRARLAVLYGDRAGLSAGGQADGSYAVRLHLPYELPPSGPPSTN